MSLKVLAEGVETPEEMDFLTNELCAEAQGFYFGRPGDMSDFADLMDGAPRPAKIAPATDAAEPPLRIGSANA
jgi:EAL domain-containing protein (putative c-di-GMP-specific phosphodiesterase class I)